MSPARLALLLLCVCSSFAVRAADAPATRPAGQEDDEPTAKMRELFADLARDDAAVRDDARYQLMGLGRRDLPRLQRLVRDSAPLLPSQAIVLRQIVTQVYLAGEPYDSDGHFGFLGIRMAQTRLVQAPAKPAKEEARPDDGEEAPADLGIVVMERIPGFCGARSLQDGDVILGIVERPEVQMRGRETFPAATDAFSNAIKSLGPGQTIHFQLLRRGRVIRVPTSLDPRPADAELELFTPLVNRRRTKAEEYWQRTFAPLLKETGG